MKICGIYKIESIYHPDRIYIGSSINIKRRWTDHKNLLKFNRHKSPKLQNHYNKYKKEDLVYSIVLECDSSILIKNEQYFIDLYKPYFNICPIAASTLNRPATQKQKEAIKYCQTKEAIEKSRLSRLGMVHSEETKLKISQKAKNRKVTDNQIYKLRISSHNFSIVQLDLNGNFIKEWHCPKCASKELKISLSGIRYCIKGIRKTANGFKWKYK